jgi:hypothetical protein
MTYRLLPRPQGGVAEDMVLREADGAIIPRDRENIDWLAYLDWRSAGGAPRLPDAAPDTPPASEESA